MAAEKSFVQRYAASDMDERLNIIFRHFDNFLELVDMFEGNLFETIKEEKLYNRRQQNGDLGIRVQTSGKSDPTGMEATGNVTLIQDIQSGRIEDALKGADHDVIDGIDHRTEIETLRDMRSDYNQVGKAMKLLPFKARVELKDILTGKRDLTQIAEESGCIYDSVKVRLYRTRRKVKDQAIYFIEEEKHKRSESSRWEERYDAKNGQTNSKSGGSSPDRSEKICQLQRSDEALFAGKTYSRRAC